MPKDEGQFIERLLELGVSKDDISGPFPSQFLGELLTIDVAISRALASSTPEEYEDFLEALLRLIRTAPQRFQIDAEMGQEQADESFWGQAWGGQVQ